MKVTAHATIRWLERVKGMDLSEVKSEMREQGRDWKAPGVILRHLWKTREIDGDDIRAEILSPFVTAAIQAGVSKIRLATATLIIRDKNVVSVLRPDMKISR